MKRIAELRELSDDHHTGLVLARRCKQASLEGSELAAKAPEWVWEQVLQAFSVHLEPHFRIEELHLLPALEAIGEGSLASRIVEDHDALRALRGSDLASRELLGRFGKLLESHIRFEERQVFEPTQKRLSHSALQAIESACREIPRLCPAFLEP